MANHSWYLHESLITLRLCDSKVSDDVQRKVADIIIDINPHKHIPIQYKKSKIEDIIKCNALMPSLDDFIKPGSKIIFDILNMNDDKLMWLLSPPNAWKLMSQFKKLSEFTANMPVFNDADKHNVKLIQDYVVSSKDEQL